MGYALYLRPDGVSYYLRPGGQAYYLRPGQPQITLFDANGQTGASYITAGEGLYFLIYAGLSDGVFAVWFKVISETQPSGDYNFIMVDLTANGALTTDAEIAAAVVISPAAAGFPDEWTMTQVDGTGALFTSNINNEVTNAMDVNTGATITTVQEGNS